MKATVTIEGQDYGEIDIPQGLVHGKYQDPTGFAYFCPDCGRIWAEIRVLGQKMYAVTIPCKQHHRDFYWPGGSIWLGYWPHIVNSFNREILLYETRRHFELFDQNPEVFKTADAVLL